MANIKSLQTLSIICPTLNEASQLPLLIADINLWPDSLDIHVVDGGSKDLSAFIAQLAGANVTKTNEANRGSQLNIGAQHAKGDWLLFIHADSRLHKQWAQAVKKIINNPLAQQSCWYFDLRVNTNSIALRLLEIFVALRCRYFKTPYGDQGLLITKELYLHLGGYSNLHIMEDIDFILRSNRYNHPKRIELPIYTSGRKWKESNIISQAIMNAFFRYRWRKGVDSKQLAKAYYKIKRN